MSLTRRELLLATGGMLALVATKSGPAFADAQACLGEPATNKISNREAENRAVGIINRGSIQGELDGIGSTDVSNIQFHLNSYMVQYFRSQPQSIDTDPFETLQGRGNRNSANNTYSAVREAVRSGRNESHIQNLISKVPEDYRDIVAQAYNDGYIGNYGRVFGDMSKRALEMTAEKSGIKDQAGLFEVFRNITQQMIEHANGVCRTPSEHKPGIPI